jgi:protein-arginine kinase activator protein McsA
MGIQYVEEGIEKIRNFYRENSRSELAEQSGEVQSLENWLEEIRSKRPLSPREKLERALHEAVSAENYEKAAKVRDALKNLKSN